ncbi:Uu.00g135910.m01.CDS01 [Anthostomella pinea]|uniref:Uu.00g135910.m01.CDS01 n=1 Tax=Anthostomella pinea TaxID=933095 RepID=A0AAI8YIJ5_9PEZI|nr:Uu.00g135910.m01.CDS01 [Anthostomella pinea]
MAKPSFLTNFKQLRRRSRASFRNDDRSTTDASSTEDRQSQNTTPTTGSITPPSITTQSDPAINNLKDLSSQSTASLPTRPPLQSYANSNRYSVSGMTGLGSPSLNGKSTLPVSQYAPRLTNLIDGSWVHQKALLVSGTIGEGLQHSLDGNVTVSRLDDGFPPTCWPVCDSQFKALVYLMPGANKLRFDFTSPKLANSDSPNPIHATHIVVHMIPPISSPPLQLAILLAKDSPGTFDAVPARIEKEGNGLETAIRKFRMATYLWQAFTAEEMRRNRFGRRTFRFEEEWMNGSCNQRDREMGTMRSEARIHIIRSDKTVAEIRDLERAQQNHDGKKKGELFDIAAEAVKSYFKPLPGQKQYVSVLILDSHWDTTSKTITGHAALGGSAGDLQLAICGSHALQSYPMTFEEVVPAFTDCTPTDTNFVANDCNESGSSWEAANVGIGAHLHETGHLFGCPHQESGVMMRDYVKLNRSFVAREAYSTRTKSKGGLVMQADECTWHRLDCLRFRSHPCFRLPNDPVSNPDDSVQAWPVDNGQVQVTAATGVSFIELYTEGDDVCHTWIEYKLENGCSQRNITLTEQQLREKLPENKRRSKLTKVCIKSHGGGNLDIPDFEQLLKTARLKLSFFGNPAFRGNKLGFSQMEGSKAEELIFTSSTEKGKDRVLSRIVFYHGFALDGMEFVYDNGDSQLFGKRGGKPGGDTFKMDIPRGENITGFYVRSGFWIDAIQVWTSLGRKSPVYGNVNGGSPHTLLPPPGFRVCGVTGSSAAWVDGFSLIITR